MSQRITPSHSHFGFGVFAGLLVSILLATTLQIGSTSAADPKKPFDPATITKIQKELQNGEATLETVSATYHSAVNDVFNEQMRLFAEGKSNTAPPKNNEECNYTSAGSSKKNPINISTYCLYLRIEPLYDTYTQSLVRRQGSAISDATDIIGGQDAQRTTTNFVSARRGWIDREIASVKRALDNGLKAYSEMLMQYPLHQEYEKTIKLLVKYYDHLIGVRKKVDTYPKRFHNVTSTQCT